MNIIIKLNNETKDITVNIEGSKKALIINESSDDWTMNKINEFILRIANNKPDNEDVKVIPEESEWTDEENSNEQFKLIHSLFSKFAEGINN